MWSIASRAGRIPVTSRYKEASAPVWLITRPKCYNFGHINQGAVSVTRPFRFSHGAFPPEESFETSQLFGIRRCTVPVHLRCLGSQETIQACLGRQTRQFGQTEGSSGKQG